MTSWITSALLGALVAWGAQAQERPIVIGASVSETGALADLAGPYRNGMLLWEEQANAAGGLLGRRVTLRLLDDGSDSINGTLSRARADAVLRRLNPQRFSAIEFSAVGMGSTAPIGVGTTGQEKEQNRRVSLRTQLLDAAGGGGER